MINRFPLGTDLCSTNMVSVVTFLVRQAKRASHASLARWSSDSNCICRGGSFHLCDYAVVLLGQHSCRAQVRVHLPVYQYSNCHPQTSCRSCSWTCNRRYCCYLSRGYWYWSYHFRDIFFRLDRCFYRTGCEIPRTLPYSAHARDCLHHVRLVPHFLP